MSSIPFMNPDREYTPSLSHASSFSTISAFFNTCSHKKTAKSSDCVRENCFYCGIHISNSGVKAFKSKKFDFQPLMDVSQHYESMCKKSLKKVCFKPDHKYSQERIEMINWVFSIADNLKISTNTTHLAINFMDYFVNKTYIPQTQYMLYSTTSLMLAAKAVELDERIPFISKLRRYSSSLFQADEIRKAERHLLECLDWNLQNCTLFDILEYYLSQGIIFSTDILMTSSNSTNDNNILREKKANIMTAPLKSDDPLEKAIVRSFSSLGLGDINNTTKTVLLSTMDNSRIYDLVSKIEREAIRLANMIVRDTSFAEFEDRFLAAAAVAFLRKITDLRPIWNYELQVISGGIKEEGIMLEILEKIKVRYEAEFNSLFKLNFMKSFKRIGSQDFTATGITFNPTSTQDKKENLNSLDQPLLTDRKSPLINPSFILNNPSINVNQAKGSVIPPKPSLLLASSNNFFEKKAKI